MEMDIFDGLCPDYEAQVASAAMNLELQGLVSSQVVDDIDHFNLTEQGEEKARQIYSALPPETRVLLRLYIGHLELDRIEDAIIGEELAEDDDEEEDNPDCAATG